MNFTDKYIKMAEQATEIQEGWKPERTDCIKGDFIGFIKEVGIMPLAGGGASHECSIERFSGDKESFGKYAWYSNLLGEKENELIFLPLQHQLQEMCREKLDLINLFVTFNSWVTGKTLGNVKAYKVNEFTANNWSNFNELWLAFTMHELYKKKWNNAKEVWE